MDKQEALEALEKAHKLRKHAEKIEREAHEILDKREERHEDEHEVKASASPAFEKARQHAVLHALHSMNKDFYKANHDVAKSIADRTGDAQSAKKAAWLKSKSNDHAVHAEIYKKAAVAGFKSAGYPDHKIAGVLNKAKKHFEKKHGLGNGDAYDHDWFAIDKSIKKANHALGK